MDEDPTPIINEIQNLRISNSKIMGILEEHIKNEDNFWEMNRYEHKKTDDRLQLITKTIMENMRFQNIAENAQKDIDDHKKGHTKTFRNMLLLSGTIGGSIAWLINKADAIGRFFSELGKIQKP